MEKRGQSEVITTVLIILLVIAAVFIVYVAVRNMIKGGVDNISTDPLAIGFTTTGVSIDPTATSVNIPVSRKAGGGNVSEIRILFKGADGATKCTYSNKTAIPKELEAVIYAVDLTDCAGAVSYEVYPVITSSSGKEVIGMKAIGTSSSGGGGGSSGGGGPGTGGCLVSCGTDSWMGNPLCNLSNGNLYQNYIDYTCSGSSCTNVTSSRQKTDCAGKGCIGGVCNSAPVVPIFTGEAVNECKTLSQANTVYYLNKSISSTETCLTITANNIVLDGNGKTITTSAGNSVVISATSNIAIFNATISSNTYSGIVFTNSITSPNITKNIINAGTSGSCSDNFYYCSGIAFNGNTLYGKINENDINLNAAVTRNTGIVWTSQAYSVSGVSILANNISEAYSGIDFGYSAIAENISTIGNSINKGYSGSSGSGVGMYAILTNSSVIGNNISGNIAEGIRIDPPTSSDYKFGNIFLGNRIESQWWGIYCPFSSDIMSGNIFSGPGNSFTSTGDIHNLTLLDQEINSYSVWGGKGYRRFKIIIVNSTSGIVDYYQNGAGIGILAVRTPPSLSSNVKINKNSIWINGVGTGLNASSTLTLYNAGSNTFTTARKNGGACGDCTGFQNLGSGNYRFDVALTDGTYSVA